MPQSFDFVPFDLGNTEEVRRLGGLDPRMSRSHYFDGRLLKASDLVRDQIYLDERLREVGRALGSGIAYGMVATLGPNESLTVSPGVAVAPSGRVLELSDELTLSLAARAEISTLNRGKYRRFQRGLYAVALRFAERGRDSAEVYPQDPGGDRSIRFNSYEEGVELVLVRLRAALPLTHSLGARIALGSQFLRQSEQPPELDDDAVALAVIGVDRDRVVWLDRGLVYRPLREPNASAREQRDLAAHYSEIFEAVMAARSAATLDGDFSARQYFRQLPPCGPLPIGAIDPVTGRQGYFPEHYSVSVAPIRRDDLAQVQQECLELDVLDLDGDLGADILVVAPLSDSDFTWHGRRLERPSPPTLPRLLPRIDPLRLRYRPRPTPHPLDTDAAVWQEIWNRVNPAELRYLRRPARVAETRVSSIVLANGFDFPPQQLVLPEVVELTEKLAEANQKADDLTSALAAANAQIRNLKDVIAKLRAQQGSGTRLTDLVASRGLLTKRTAELAASLVSDTPLDEANSKLLEGLLQRIPAVYDEAFWPLLAELGKQNPAGIPGALKQVSKLLLATDETTPLPRLVLEAADTLKLSVESVAAWKRVLKADEVLRG